MSVSLEFCWQNLILGKHQEISQISFQSKENTARDVLKLYIENLNLRAYEVWSSLEANTLQHYIGDTKPEFVLLVLTKLLALMTTDPDYKPDKGN
ncbi:hypothetical protein VNO80_15022 [Phaseolus coccineus]|uniref:Uncharacterized protein n=1 Tax=Phaseolus coccineus TaxID=3886 RepID=A0AAN9QYX6_PHACN